MTGQCLGRHSTHKEKNLQCTLPYGAPRGQGINDQVPATSRRHAAGAGYHPLQPRSSHGARPREARSVGLRVLRGGQTGIRPADSDDTSGARSGCATTSSGDRLISSGPSMLAFLSTRRVLSVRSSSSIGSSAARHAMKSNESPPLCLATSRYGVRIRRRKTARNCWGTTIMCGTEQIGSGAREHNARSEL